MLRACLLLASLAACQGEPAPEKSVLSTGSRLDVLTASLTSLRDDIAREAASLDGLERRQASLSGAASRPRLSPAAAPSTTFACPEGTAVVSALELICEGALSEHAYSTGLEGITREDSRSYTITAEAWARIRSDGWRPGSRGTPAVVPVPSGGIRLFGIPRGSLLWVLGLRNGDAVERVNGAWLTMEGLRELRSVEAGVTLEVELQRRGRSFQHTYRIEP